MDNPKGPKLIALCTHKSQTINGVLNDTVQAYTGAKVLALACACRLISCQYNGSNKREKIHLSSSIQTGCLPQSYAPSAECSCGPLSLMGLWGSKMSAFPLNFSPTSQTAPSRSCKKRDRLTATLGTQECQKCVRTPQAASENATLQPKHDNDA